MHTVGWTALFIGKGLTEGKDRGVMGEPRRVTAVMRGWYRVKRAEVVREREREKARIGAAGDESRVVAEEKLRETETWPNRN